MEAAATHPMSFLDALMFGAWTAVLGLEADG
jgi:hypothetical protein